MMEILRGNLSMMMMNNNCVRRQPVPGVSDTILPTLHLHSSFNVKNSREFVRCVCWRAAPDVIN
jgi:hypothetical protein